MSLVESALACAPDEREAFTRSACGDPELFQHVWRYVEREQRLGEFLQEPLYRPNYPEQPFEPGERLEGRFRIEREVARGGMGIVYEAFDEKLDRKIAVKCAKAGFGRSLPPEVRHASEISHPNVCKIFEIHTANTRRGQIDFLTMEFLEGETLAARLSGGPTADGPMPRAQAMEVGRQIAAGLAAAHQAGLVHGDLKSNNVILTQGPGGAVRAVITDFGLARRPDANDPLRRDSQIAGAPDYMAPELLKGGKPSMASDVYALGVILYELMAGRRPFPAELSRAQRLNVLPAPARSPWDHTIGRCLNPNPERRAANAQTVVEEIKPKAGRIRLALAAVVLMIAAAGSLWSYRQANGPDETVQLAVLSVEAPPDLMADGKALPNAVAAKLRLLKGSRKTSFSVMGAPGANATAEQARAALATHVLEVKLNHKNDQIILDSSLRDVVTGTKVEHWEASYGPGQLRYAPVALSGFVTESLHLVPAEAASVNSSARQDYEDAVALLPMRSKTDRALELLDRAVLTDPDSPLVWAALAEAQWLRYGRSADAIWLERSRESHRQAELRNPDVASVHRIAGMLLLQSGRYDAAIARFLRAIELDPGSSEGYRRLGGAYQNNLQMEAATAMFDKAVRVEPKAYLAWWDRGYQYFRRGRYVAAAADFAKAAELAPEEAGPQADLAQAYLASGRLVEAEGAARLATDRDRTGRTLNLLGLALIYQSKDLQAIPYLVEAAAKRPQALYYLYLGVAYRRALKFTEARDINRKGLDVAHKELEGDYRNGVTRATIAYLSAQLGDRSEAMSEADQAIAFSPADADARFLVALTYEALGEHERTFKILEDATPEVLSDLSRWPDVADLARDSRFLQIVASKNK